MKRSQVEIRKTFPRCSTEEEGVSPQNVSSLRVIVDAVRRTKCKPARSSAAITSKYFDCPTNNEEKFNSTKAPTKFCTRSPAPRRAGNSLPLT